MKYYIYISDAKIDMLLPQVPHDIRQKVAVEFKTDIKIFSASRKTETESDDNRIARLESVLDFLRQYSDLGSVDRPGEYIADSISMRWGPYTGTGPNTVVYFGGETERTAIGLGGSIRHVLGAVGNDSPTVGSLTPFIMKTLVHELNLDQPEIHPSLATHPDAHTLPFAAILLANQNMMGPTQRLEFVAKRLLDSDRDLSTEERETTIQHNSMQNGSHLKRILLGTPLYVALAD
jgi:hypothetical protein